MKILVAIDQSAFWPQIIDTLVKQKWIPGTQFKILTVIEPLPLQWEQLCTEEWKKLAHEVFEKKKAAAETVVASARHKVQHAVSDCLIHTDVRNGHAREEILNTAVDWMPDKIILGAHGRSSNRLFPGAVSHAVAQHAPCSVELVRLVNPPEPTPAQANSVHQETIVSRK